MERSGRGSGLEKGGRDKEVDLLSVLCRDSHSLSDGPLRSRESFLESFPQQRKDIFPGTRSSYHIVPESTARVGMRLLAEVETVRSEERAVRQPLLGTGQRRGAVLRDVGEHRECSDTAGHYPCLPFLHGACFLYRGLWHVHSFEERLHNHRKIFPRVVSPTLNQLVRPLLQEANGMGSGLAAPAPSLCNPLLRHRMKQSLDLE